LRKHRGNVVWEDAYQTVPEPATVMLEIKLDLETIEKLAKAGHNRAVLEIDCFMMPSPVRDGKDRPYPMSS